MRMWRERLASALLLWCRAAGSRNGLGGVEQWGCGHRLLRPALLTALSAFLFEEVCIRNVDVQDNMSNASEERSTRQQDIKKGLQFIEYGATFFYCGCTCLWVRTALRKSL